MSISSASLNAFVIAISYSYECLIWNVSIVVLVLAGVTSNLMLPELTSALNENNDELEYTSPY